MKNFFIRRPIFAISLSVIIVLLGAISITNLAIEQYPDITPPVVEVTATYEGADAETVNNAVATPIAESIMGVSDMLYMQATSANDGSMTLQVTFDIGSDADLDAIFTQNNVSTAMAKLPSSVTQQGVVTRKTQTGFLMVYALYSDGRYDENFLSNYAYINLENELLKINGIGKVNIMGAGEYAMRVWLRPDLLAYYNISVSEILNAISVEAGIYPAGKFGAEPTPPSTQYTYTVTMPRQISTTEEFGNILLRTTEKGTQVRLRDVATIELGNQNYGASSRFGDKPTTIISIYQEPNSNAVALGKVVKAKMSELSERMPDGVKYEVLVDGTKSISAGIHEIFETLIIALILVILIIFIFLQDWRATLIPLIAIPVSIIGTFMVFPLLGFTINIISLLGLVLSVGLVVDDAIVVVEAVQANIERGMDSHKATEEAMRKVTSPIIATTVVLMAVFLPISFSGGISARLFQQFAVTISVSVIFSMINALSLSPALCAMLLRPRKERTQGFFGVFNRFFDKAMGRYGATIGKVVSRWRTTIAMVAVMMVAIVAMLKILPRGFLPNEDLGFFTISVTAPDNTALSRTEQIMAKVDSVTKATLPIVESTGVVSGFNLISGVASTNCGVIFVKLVDFDKRKLSSMEAVAKLNEVLYTAIPEAECGAFVSPAIPGLGVTSGVTFELQDRAGRGTAYLAEQSDKLLSALRKEPRIKSATTEFRNGVAQKHLDIDKQHAQMSGVSLSSLYSETATLLGGRMINNFNLFGRLYQSYLQAAPEYRTDASSLNNFFLKNGDNESVPLSSFVTVRDTTGVQYVSQFNLYRSIGINVTPDEGASTGDIMNDIERVASEILPDDTAIAWSGVSFQERTESGKGGWVFAIAFIFVFFTLSALYESWSLPMSIVLGVPLAVLGALCAVGLAHLIAPQFINDIYMQISLAMLIGLAAKNSILVVEYADKLFYEEQQSLLDATINAAKMRVRPILMTAFASILGMLPLVFASGVYSTARNIMGVSLVGGLLFATIFGILLYPALFYLVGKVARFERKTENGKRKIMHRLPYILLVLVFVSCNPRLSAPQLASQKEYLFGEGFSSDSIRLGNDWWQMFGDTTLNRLVVRAIAQNKNIEIAASRIEEARHNLVVTRSTYWPSISGAISVEGKYESATEGIAQLYKVLPQASWELPLFGSLRHATKGAKAAIEYEVWQYRGVRLALEAEVATSYFTLLQYRQDLAIAKRSSELRREMVSLIDSLYHYGYASGVNLEQARSLLYTAEADIPLYEKAISQTLLSLAILTGDAPESLKGVGLANSNAITNDYRPYDIAIGVPSDILHRRPDVMSAYYTMQQSAAAVGLARTARLPSVTISLYGGTATDKVSKLFSSKGWVADALAALTQPIYNFGGLRRRELAAREAYKQSLLAYEQSYIEALSDVESALVAITTSRAEILRYAGLVKSYRNIAVMTYSLYRNGLSGYLDVIDAERSLYSSQMQFENLVAQQYINYINLCKALGGGY